MSEKKLIGEPLPAPHHRPEEDARARVLRQMRNALAAGAATLTLGGCPPGCTPFGVVDPMPPPARCRTMGASAGVLGSVSAEGEGAGRTLKVVLTVRAGSDWSLGTSPTATGAKLLKVEGSKGRGITVTVAPDPAAPHAVLRVPMSCEERPGTPPLTATLVATVNTPSAEHPDVTFEEEP